MVHWQVYNESVFDLLARDVKDCYLSGHADPSLDLTDEISLGMEHHHFCIGKPWESSYKPGQSIKG